MYFQKRRRPVARVSRSGDTTPCQVTPVILHRVISPDGEVTPVIPHGVASPDPLLVAAAIL